MIRILRYSGLRLWLLLLWGIPVGFWLLFRIMVWLPDLSAGMAMVLFLAGGGCVQGLILDLIGRQRVRSLIREGELWEQAGIRPRAEERYLRAVRVFDSILVSPWFSRNLSRDLSRVMGGFYLSGQARYPGFRQAAAQYLLSRPGDEALAQLWLERALAPDGGQDRDRVFSDVLTALAQEHQDNPKLAFGLTVLFLDQDRADFSARRLYRSVLRLLEGDPPEAAILARAYVEKLKTFLAPRGGMDGMGDPESDPEGIGATLGSQMKSPEILTPDRFERTARTLGRQIFRLPGRMAGTAGVFVFNIAQPVVNACARLAGAVGLKREKRRQYVKATLISALAVCLGIFLWSSLAHMLKSTSTEPVVHPVGDAAPGPFTIQVAAYLKQSHADRYLKKLKGKGLQAHVKKTRGGGKTWYLVRVSHFKTKQQAATYGRTLKSQGKIEDFFVSNS
jgi:hypothetical protein